MYQISSSTHHKYGIVTTVSQSALCVFEQNAFDCIHPSLPVLLKPLSGIGIVESFILESSYIIGQFDIHSDSCLSYFSPVGSPSLCALGACMRWLPACKCHQTECVRIRGWIFCFFLNSSLKRHYWCSLRRLMPCRGRAASEQSFVGSIWGFYHSATVPAGIQELKSSGGLLSKTASNYKTRNSWDVRCTRASQNNSTNNGHI